MKGILFKPDMIEAILKGRKTVTRRLGKFYKAYDIFPNGKREVEAEQTIANMKLPKYKKGEIIYVKEPYIHTSEALNIHPTDENSSYIYKFTEKGQDFERNFEEWKWKNAMFMPEAAARLFLEITNVRVERLHDITESDAIAEGVKIIKTKKYGLNDEFELEIWLDYEDKRNDYGCSSAKKSYMTLWNKINGRGSWEENPLVYAYNFEIHKIIE